MRTLLLSYLLIIGYNALHAQSIRMLTSGHNTSIRGLSAPDEHVVWASGSNGQIGRSVDAGEHWTWRVVSGFEKTDFRDIEAFDSLTAVIMGISEPGHILCTSDGGRSWQLVYADSSKGVFMDAMHFQRNGKGIVVGDPIDGKIYVVLTSDYGRNWKRIDPAILPALANGEAFFASSGGNVLQFKSGAFGAVTGGLRSRWLTPTEHVVLPLQQGRQSTGANAVAAGDKGLLVAVGGDFSNDKRTDSTCAISKDAGKTWQHPVTGLNGYRSSVTSFGKGRFIACGTSGVDMSSDGGMHWKSISTEGFHVCVSSGQGKRVYMAGSKGRVAVLEGLRINKRGAKD
jgi:photosystem II stability/assembly factor-like uncharacterized protein